MKNVFYKRIRICQNAFHAVLAKKTKHSDPFVEPIIGRTILYAKSCGTPVEVVTLSKPTM